MVEAEVISVVVADPVVTVAFVADPGVIFVDTDVWFVAVAYPEVDAAFVKEYEVIITAVVVVVMLDPGNNRLVDGVESNFSVVVDTYPLQLIAIVVAVLSVETNMSACSVYMYFENDFITLFSMKTEVSK